MKLTTKFAAILLLMLSSSCAMMFKDKEVEVKISSTPAGADIFIEGKNYGKTPATLKIIPKNYTVILTKQGYGSAQLKLESWAAIRDKSGDRGRCVADALGTMLILPYYSLVYSGACSEFKQKEYFATIPYLGAGAGMMGSGQRSMMGVGQDPQNMVNYYYGQNPQNGSAQGGNARR